MSQQEIKERLEDILKRNKAKHEETRRKLKKINERSGHIDERAKHLEDLFEKSDKKFVQLLESMIASSETA